MTGPPWARPPPPRTGAAIGCRRRSAVGRSAGRGAAARWGTRSWVSGQVVLIGHHGRRAQRCLPQDRRSARRHRSGRGRRRPAPPELVPPLASPTRPGGGRGGGLAGSAARPARGRAWRGCPAGTRRPGLSRRRASRHREPRPAHSVLRGRPRCPRPLTHGATAPPEHGCRPHEITWRPAAAGHLGTWAVHVPVRRGARRRGSTGSSSSTSPGGQPGAAVRAALAWCPLPLARLLLCSRCAASSSRS